MVSNITVKVKIRGVVQGVGFRPFIYHIATHYDLKGWVLNSSNGVEILVTGNPNSVKSFLDEIKQNPPTLARIDSIETNQEIYQEFRSFEIRMSESKEGEFIPVSPDICTCDDCLQELINPADRRYRYPFINCTNCGPRFTIIQNIPYDRPLTTMSEFEMCEDCKKEYEDPENRRFHAQPIACPKCGPHISYFIQNTKVAENDEALRLARKSIIKGEILAIKGLGGYHLACNATDHEAVRKLRNRKKRSDKPFALMAYSLEQVSRYCEISVDEKNLLESIERPIVLLDRKYNSELALDVAPGQRSLGIMLPYTPLHYLLLEPETGFPDLLVMTSGNMSEEPIAYQDDDAEIRLNSIADSYLIHNRQIQMRVDDSVTRIINDTPFILRRSRGYAPNSFPFPYSNPSILATGAELKNTFCLTRDNLAFLSHHIGDLENLETYNAFEESITHFEKLFRIDPKIIACDLHPNYLATRYGIARAEKENKKLLLIQHHHAHLAACIAENRPKLESPIIGLCFDGTGLGTDHAIWGGEVLIGKLSQYIRRFHLKYVPLPGGDVTIRIPARMALTHLWANNIEWDPSFLPAQDLCVEEKNVLRTQLTKGINSPPTSSMGRLFDAIASFIGVRQRVNYEGQAAIEMESMVDFSIQDYYSFNLANDLIDAEPLWNQIVRDFLANASPTVMASKFHNSVSQLCLDICQVIKKESGITTVALSGGVWQNKVLIKKTISLLQQNHFEVLWHSKIPTNDGGIAFGQACIAANTILN
ncbi:MAG: carbamoyltransferase HypF [Chloroflexi bacterium HGW-Chloroflexi-8]|nr:MAG: carbamoyltransferase HypF [Chloroflexi bacterium HGW-Chloroflexi-8]